MTTYTIKKLRWERVGPEKNLHADGAGCTYVIQTPQSRHYNWRLLVCKPPSRAEFSFPTKAEAKAAAQAHFEATLQQYLKRAK